MRSQQFVLYRPPEGGTPTARKLVYRIHPAKRRSAMNRNSMESKQTQMNARPR